VSFVPVGEGDVKDEGEASTATVTGSQGVQVGAGNTQHIYSGPKSPLDPSALSGLNPHTAVARLQRLSHDELLDFFARAEPSDVSEIVDVLREADLAKLTRVLADINRRKSIELIEGSSLDPRLFLLLPKASEAISRKAASLRWSGAGEIDIWIGGYQRWYDNGCVSWSEEFGIFTTVGTIAEYAAVHRCGYATGSQKSSGVAESQKQRFQRGTVYSSTLGTFLVMSNSCYEDQGGSTGWLGLPVGESEKNGSLGELQRFQFGTIYSFNREEKSQSFAVVGEIVEILPRHRKCRPISEEGIAKPPSGRGMTVQHFELEMEVGTSETAVYWDEANEPVMVAREIWGYYTDLGLEKSWLGFPVKSDSNALHIPSVSVIMPELGDKVTEGTVTIWLKKEGERVIEDEPLLEVSTDKVDTEIPAPASGILRGIVVDEDETVPVGTKLAMIGDTYPGPIVTFEGILQMFEYGQIYWRPGASPIAISASTIEFIRHKGQRVGWIGFPVTEEQPAGSDGSGRIQFFDNGVITLRDGKREIWLRPD
jgi:Biotin-requiring enzyme